MNENQFGVMLENILDKVNAIAEGQRNIERDLKSFRDETGQRFDKVDGRLGKVENRLDKVENRLEKVENRLDSMEKEIKAVKTYVIGIDDAINQHEKRIQAVEKDAM